MTLSPAKSSHSCTGHLWGKAGERKKPACRRRSEGVFLLPPPGRPSRKEDGPTRRWCKSNQHPCLGRGWRIFSHRHLPSLEKPRHFREEGDLPPAGARRLSDPAGKEETPARL